MSDDLSPTLRRWELGGALRRLREDRGKTIEQVAQDLAELHGTGFSAAKISRLETGRRGAIPRDVRDLCEYYQVDHAERDRLMALSKDARLDNRLQDIATAYAEYIALESVAHTVRAYEPVFVPGLLQTVDYHRATFDNYTLDALRSNSPNKDPQALIDIRRQRQLRLEGDNALYLRAIIDENAIRRGVGSSGVMSAQLTHLIEMSRWPNIIIRIIPISFGVYPGCESAGFSLLEYDKTESLRENACFVEGFTQALWAEQAADRNHAAAVFTHLESIALDPEESRAFIAETLSSM